MQILWKRINRGACLPICEHCEMTYEKGYTHILDSSNLKPIKIFNIFNKKIEHTTIYKMYEDPKYEKIYEIRIYKNNENNLIYGKEVYANKYKSGKKMEKYYLLLDLNNLTIENITKKFNISSRYVITIDDLQ